MYRQSNYEAKILDGLSSRQLEEKKIRNMFGSKGQMKQAINSEYAHHLPINQAPLHGCQFLLKKVCAYLYGKQGHSFLINDSRKNQSTSP